MKYLVVLATALSFFSCKKDRSNADEITTCYFSCTGLQVDSALAQPKGTLFYQIDAYNYNGALVHLYYYGCCDRYNKLVDANCNYLFSPSGGYSGAGDNTHPNFFKEATFVTTVWKDPR